MKLALVHDWLNQIGGAEDVLTELVGMFPDAPLYTSIYWREEMPATWQQWNIRTLWMDKLPSIYRHHQRYLPLYPLAFGNLDLAEYDLVITNKSGFCHGVKTSNHKLGKKATHVCYCLAPTRYLWQYDAYVTREGFGNTLKRLIQPVIGRLKRWDYAAAQRVDHFIAISTEIQARIKQFYNRDSRIIFPPVNTTRFQPVDASEVSDYYLIVSRLIPYKRVDLAVEACTRLNLPLLVAGAGRDREMLQKMAGDTIRFAGYVSDEELPRLMARCKAFLFPGLEDFGITPVQAQAAGRPVIAYRGGGALDTVLDGTTGLFFEEPTVESLMDALQRFEASSLAAKEQPQLTAQTRNNAMRFDQSIFQRELRGYLSEVMGTEL